MFMCKDLFILYIDLVPLIYVTGISSGQRMSSPGKYCHDHIVGTLLHPPFFFL